VNERAERVAARFETPILVAALLVVPVLVIEESQTSAAVKTVGHVLNWLIWLAFVSELVVMLRVVDDRRAWLRSHPVEIAVIVLTPPFLPAGLAAVRLLRLVRLLVLIRALRTISPIEGLRYIAVLVVLTIIAGGTAFASVEEGASQWDGIWWAIVTMATVGYGDVYPVTDGGRIIGIAVMLTGIAFLTVLVGAVAERFASPAAEEVEEEIDSLEAVLLAELRTISERLSRLEAKLEQRP
jgi:voltage-gated potassium channel